MTRSDLSPRNQRLNPTRTSKELAAFKAANRAAAKAVHVIPGIRKGQTFTITWQTSLGRFGWCSFHGCKDMSEAVARFQVLRQKNDKVPFDACIDVVKAGGQEI